MNVAGVYLELYGRIVPLAREAVDGLNPSQLAATPAPGTNSIGWLVWHLARVEDHHVSELLDAPQLWQSGDWAGRCGLEPDPRNTGYGHTPDQVASVRPEPRRRCSTTSTPPTPGPARSSRASPRPTSIASSTGGGTRP